MGGSEPKILLPLAGVSLIERSVQTFLGHPGVGELVAMVPETLLLRCRALLHGLPNPRRVRVETLAGGATRQESVRIGLAALTLGLPYVAVHDVARPLVSQDLIRRVLDAAGRVGAALPALPVTDTIKEIAGDRVVRTVPRETLRAAQTPQIFQRDILARAHAHAAAERIEATDDAMLVELLGAPVAVVPGDPANLKLTEPSDVTLLESHLRSRRAS